MSDEVRHSDQQRGHQGRPKNVEIHGAKKTEEKGTQIIGGGSAKRTGPLKTLDSRSPVEDQIVEVTVHDDAKSYRDALEDKDK